MLKKLKEYKFYLILIMIVLLFNIRLPYYINAPGGIISVFDRIEYSNKKELNGSINMLYVTEYNATIPIYLLSYIIKEWDLSSIEEDKVNNDEDAIDLNTRNKIMLNTSINNAIYVAYKNAKKEVSINNKRFVIIASSNEVLKIGDEVLKINGQDVTSLSVIKDEIEKNNVGDEVSLLIKRDKKEVNYKVKIKEEAGSKVLGIVITTDYDLKTDPTIKLNFKSSESGSSGGLMLALGIYNVLVDEDLLKGRNIAGTGTIDIDGNVGEIAGIKYKIMGAVKNDIDVVFVAVSNYDEALSVKEDNGYDIEIVSVSTFDDAVNFLKST